MGEKAVLFPCGSNRTIRRRFPKPRQSRALGRLSVERIRTAKPFMRSRTLKKP